MTSIAVQEFGTIELPPPRWARVRPLLDVLRERRSEREFSAHLLALPVLSSLLWSAFGINRPQSGGRTAPSAHDWQEIEVFAMTADGAYRYDAREHVLRLVKTGDLRALAGTQEFVGTAPLELVYVADFAKMIGATEEQRAFLAAADAAAIAENVYLFCAWADLGTVVRGLVDREKLAAALGLDANERIVLAQTVGYRKG